MNTKTQIAQNAFDDTLGLSQTERRGRKVSGYAILIFAIVCASPLALAAPQIMVPSNASPEASEPKETEATLPEIEESKDESDPKKPTDVSSPEVQSDVVTRELSVEPKSQLLPKDRPAWIDSEPQLDGDTHRFVVASIPTSIKTELSNNLDAPLEAALRDYAENQLGDNAGKLIATRLTAAFIRTNLVNDHMSYVAEMETADGTQYQQWVMVEVSPAQRRQLQLWYSQEVQRQRVLPFGVLVAALLSIIGLSNWGFKRRSKKVLGANGGSFPLNKPAYAVDLASDGQEFCDASKKVSGRRRIGRLALIAAIALAIGVPMTWFSARVDKSKREPSPPFVRIERVEAWDLNDKKDDNRKDRPRRSRKKDNRDERHANSRAEASVTKLIVLQNVAE